MFRINYKKNCVVIIIIIRDVDLPHHFPCVLVLCCLHPVVMVFNRRFPRGDAYRSIYIRFRIER